MRPVLLLALLLCFVNIGAQVTVKSYRDESWKKNYRAAATKINNLVNTKLNVRFDFDKAYLYGEAWITLQPHFYATDSLNLDAKGMNIMEVALEENGKRLPLNYRYDSLNLRITLNRTYRADESYIIYINYVAKPNEYRSEGSAAITDAKGLYFINPKGEIKDKPTEIWTQGETESNSVWFPTIDKPNQKTTEEISMTVPSKYVTLSNGLLIAEKNNNDGTRTDTWKMNLPHAPYLFFMGVGEFAIIKDSYQGKEVSYYVEKEYTNEARKIFGLTPEMMAFYSRITGIDYPWPKYAQMIGRDYVSGAMENTTATLHMEAVQQNARQLTDGNKYETYVAHELFHQWFGDLVTCESWSNITLNESFADYSETLWKEYKYGKDAGDEQNYEDLQTYLQSGSDHKDLVRFYYRDKEDVLDAVSYEKGGRILNMLRNFVGDSAFFKSLHVYLTENKFKSAEAHNLRLAFEEVTGQDLNWFFNQWYYGNNHPHLDIKYSYDAAHQLATVMMQQTQQTEKIFKLPFAIDVYNGRQKTRYKVCMNSRQDTFSFPVTAKPDLIKVDAENILLAETEDHKTLAEYINQYNYAATYVDRREAIEYCLENIDKPDAAKLLLAALNDPYYNLRNLVLKKMPVASLDQNFITKIEAIAQADEYRVNRAAAIELLGGLKKDSYKDFFLKNIHDSSYSVAGAALKALYDIDAPAATALLPELKKDAKDQLKSAIDQLELRAAKAMDFDEAYSRFTNANATLKYNACTNLINYLQTENNLGNFKKAIDGIITYRNQVATNTPEISNDINKSLYELKLVKEDLKDTSGDKKTVRKQLAYLEQQLKQQLIIIVI